VGTEGPVAASSFFVVSTGSSASKGYVLFGTRRSVLHVQKIQVSYATATGNRDDFRAGSGERSQGVATAKLELPFQPRFPKTIFWFIIPVEIAAL
jgi:hypothetical protein